MLTLVGSLAETPRGSPPTHPLIGGEQGLGLVGAGAGSGLARPSLHKALSGSAGSGPALQQRLEESGGEDLGGCHGHLCEQPGTCSPRQVTFPKAAAAYQKQVCAKRAWRMTGCRG